MVPQKCRTHLDKIGVCLCLGKTSELLESVVPIVRVFHMIDGLLSVRFHGRQGVFGIMVQNGFCGDPMNACAMAALVSVLFCRTQVTQKGHI